MLGILEVVIADIWGVGDWVLAVGNKRTHGWLEYA
jgi:hypothetical protein